MNTGHRITEMFCFIQLDPTNNCEGIPAISGEMNGEKIMMPLVGADLDRLQSLIPLAKDLVRRTGRPMRLVKFKVLEEIGEVTP